MAGTERACGAVAGQSKIDSGALAVAGNRRRVAALATALAGDPETRRAAIAILREFIDRIAIGPPPAPGRQA